jgi:hypothetical protein
MKSHEDQCVYDVAEVLNPVEQMYMAPKTKCIKIYSKSQFYQVSLRLRLAAFLRLLRLLRNILFPLLHSPP